MYRYPLWSYLMDRTALQYGSVPVTNTHRALSFLGAMLRLPSLLWCVSVPTLCLFLIPEILTRYVRSLFSFFVFLFRVSYLF